jgi:hypothetical protein
LFDTETWHIGSCGGFELCNVYVPYADAEGVHVVRARNDALNQTFDLIAAPGAVYPWGTAFASSGDEQIFGLFRPTPVPEPSTLILLGTGLLLATRARSRRA